MLDRVLNTPLSYEQIPVSKYAQCTTEILQQKLFFLRIFNFEKSLFPKREQLEIIDLWRVSLARVHFQIYSFKPTNRHFAILRRHFSDLFQDFGEILPNKNIKKDFWQTPETKPRSLQVSKMESLALTADGWKLILCYKALHLRCF